MFFRLGTEEEYGSLQQLLEDLASFYEDCVAAKQALLAKKAAEAKKQEEDWQKGMDMRKAAMVARRSMLHYVVCMCNLYTKLKGTS